MGAKGWLPVGMPLPLLQKKSCTIDYASFKKNEQVYNPKVDQAASEQEIPSGRGEMRDVTKSSAALGVRGIK